MLGELVGSSKPCFKLNPHKGRSPPERPGDVPNAHFQPEELDIVPAVTLSVPSVGTWGWERPGEPCRGNRNQVPEEVSNS